MFSFPLFCRYCYLIHALLLPAGFGVFGKCVENSVSVSRSAKKCIHAVAIIFALLAISRNTVQTASLSTAWGTNVGMWSHVDSHYPEIADPAGEVFKVNLARAHLRRLNKGDVEAAHGAVRAGFGRGAKGGRVLNDSYDGPKNGASSSPPAVAGVALATIYYDAGALFAEEGEMSSAIEAYTMALEHNPFYVKALNNIGNAFADMGKLTTAAGYLERAVAVERNAQGLFNLGNLYFRSGKREDARRIYEGALEMAPPERRSMIQTMIERTKKKEQP